MRLIRAGIGAGVAVLALGSGIVTLCAEHQAGLSRSARTATSGGLRTSHGHPNLQGTWDFRTITPLERPIAFGIRTTLTNEEIAALEREASDTSEEPTRAGDVGTYNKGWMDRGTRVASNRASLIVDPSGGRIPAMLPDAQQRRAAWVRMTTGRPAGPEDQALSVRCMFGFNAGPPIEPRAYNNMLQIFQTNGHVAIHTEMNHDTRIVATDGRAHHGIPQWMGDSRGRWEGNTLVIDTVNFHPRVFAGVRPTDWRQGATPAMHVVERFTRIDADTLRYEFTVSDPATWVTPWTAVVPMKRVQEKIYEYACHEGNYSMEAMLSGARAEDREERELRRAR